MSRRMNDLIGMQFGQLTVVSFAGSIGARRKRVTWRCRCECGAYTDVIAHALTRGATKSCGCLRRLAYKNNFNHHKDPEEVRFWMAVRSSRDGCWEWQRSTRGRGPDGQYGVFVALNSKRIAAHRYSWALHFGPIPSGLSVLHRCDNPPCVRPDHLFLGTHSDNMRDCVRKGRFKGGGGVHNNHKGERNPNAKLTEADVEKIRKRYSHSLRHAIAEEYGVSPWTIYSIHQGRTWVKHDKVL